MTAGKDSVSLGNGEPVSTPLGVVSRVGTVGVGMLPSCTGWRFEPREMHMRYDGGELHLTDIPVALWESLKRYQERYEARNAGNPKVVKNVWWWHNTTCENFEPTETTRYSMRAYIGPERPEGPWGMDYVKEIFEEQIGIYLQICGHTPESAGRTAIMNDLASFWDKYRPKPSSLAAHAKVKRDVSRVLDGFKKMLDDPFGREMLLRHIS